MKQLIIDSYHYEVTIDLSGIEKTSNFNLYGLIGELQNTNRSNIINWYNFNKLDIFYTENIDGANLKILNIDNDQKKVVLSIERD